LPSNTKNFLKSKIKNIPKKPGIYFFKDKKNNVIYIGKAHSLKDRLGSYFQPTSDSKINNILAETYDIDFILTGSEKEAALLENNFIREYQPKFNLRLKDDKSFPYLKLTVQEKFPGIYLTRRVEPDGARYFGPFTIAHQARKSTYLINKYFGIRSCREAVPGKRKRPCLEYELKLCSAPCVGYISESKYRERVSDTLLFLEGKIDKLSHILYKKMMEASSNEEFEQAAHWRDLILSIEQLKEKPKLISVEKEDKDIFGFSKKNDNATVYVFIMRKGRVIESESFYIKIADGITDNEILFDQILCFYKEHKDVPSKILLPFSPAHYENLKKELSLKKRKRVNVLIPVKGMNKKLVDLTNRNAETLIQKKSEKFKSLNELKNILSLKNIPYIIEGFDISNTRGEESVGSLVVFENGNSKKESYRKFKIKTVKGPNDVASLAEVIRRRYTRLKKEGDTLPGLILLDGGKGQLHAARKVLGDLKLNYLPMIALAKKEETIFTTTKKEGLSLERTSSALKLLQSIRDEAHRFAISFHRQKRKKRSFTSFLDNISGIGEKRKNMLLTQYKSLTEIKKAPYEDLIPLIGKKATLELFKRFEKKFNTQKKSKGEK